jgi:peptide/nickel transport system substrate-binding protein
MKRWFQMSALGLLLVGVLLVSLVVSSPASRVQNALSNPKVVGAPLLVSPGRSGGELRDASTTVPRSLNPYVPITDLVALLHARLVELNPLTLAVEPALAESFIVSEDNTRLTLTLRQGLHWSDGEPVTMGDILFTFVDVLQNEQLLQTLQALGVEIQPPPYQLNVQDERTFTFVFGASFADRALLDLTRIAVVLPRHKLADTVQRLNPNAAADAFARAWDPLRVFPDQIAGLGPFRVAQIQKTGTPFINERVTTIVLERNPFYWKVDSVGTQLPYLDRFTRVFVEERSEILTQIGRGELDIHPATVADAVELANQPGVKLVVDGSVPTITVLSFNQDVSDPDLRALFRDTRFGQAVAHALERDAFLQGIPERAPFFAPRESFVHPLSPFFNEAATAKFEFDLMKARALLDDLGLRDGNGDGIREFSNGRPVVFELITNDSNSMRVAGGRLFASNLRQIGIDVDFQPIPFGEVVRRIGANTGIEDRTVDYQAVIIGFGVDNIASHGYLQCFFSSRGFCHIQRTSDGQGAELSDMQRRMDEILSNPGTTTQERTERLNELQRLMSQDLALMPLWSERAVTAINPIIQNAEIINFFGPASFVEVLWKE